jgi:iron(III) transport system substrate-binding protein
MLVAASAVAIATLTACGTTGAQPSTSSKPAAAKTVEITPALVKAAKAEGTVNVQYTTEVSSMQAVVAEFNKAYPGIDVQLTRNSGAPGGQAVLQDWQAGVSHNDVVAISDYTSAVQVVQSGAIAPLVLPKDSQRPKQYQVGPGMVSIVLETTVIGFNTNLVTTKEAESLKNWKEVLDPKWKGKINVITPTTSSGLIPALYGQKYVESDFLKKLAKNDPVLFDGTAPARDALVSGQQAISFGQFDDAMIALRATGAPVGWVYPNPTPSWGAHAFGVVANAPHPNAARLFWAWILSRKVDQGIYQSAGVSTLPGVTDEREGMPPADAAWFSQPAKLWTPTTNQWMNVTPDIRKDFSAAFGTP